MKTPRLFLILFCGAFIFNSITSCEKAKVDTPTEIVSTDNNIFGREGDEESGSAPAMLVIDEESIDNGNAPNFFSAIPVNDQIADIGLRQTLQYFLDNVGDTIDLFTGQVGDEGWFALKTIPQSWVNAGPTTNGTRNFLMAGPGLGSGNDREKHLDKIPNVTPLRAKGLKMLEGKTVLAIVYDSDISMNFDPLNGSLKGANLGVVAFDVINVQKLTGYSTSSLPRVTIVIRNVTDVTGEELQLFQNAPVPTSSSTPFDINTAVIVPEPIFIPAP